jgi:hypothetical protein
VSLSAKHRRLLGRRNLTVRIPDSMVPELCALMECRHDHPRRIVMEFIEQGLKRARRRK